MNTIRNDLIQIMLIFEKLNNLIGEEIISTKEISIITKNLHNIELYENQLSELYIKIQECANEKNECNSEELLLQVHVLIKDYLKVVENIQDNTFKKIIGKYGRYQ